jgi:hypothetical protein
MVVKKKEKGFNRKEQRVARPQPMDDGILSIPQHPV